MAPPPPYYLQKFKLYQTQSKYYMVGRDKSRTYWRVLKIDKSCFELNIDDDSMTYSQSQCSHLLKTIHGLTLITTCYGILGFIKFLGPYYMLLITHRTPIGSIGGHLVYSIAKTDLFPLSTAPTPTPTNENRYKKLLSMLDLTKDFFFSYSYNLMSTLQNNTCNYHPPHLLLYHTMFVWNEFLTRPMRAILQNTFTFWTVPLVYGFFEQDKLSISGRDFTLTLISRRSRHYAGTRYLKRGLNEMGRVANDVETEQILCEDGFPTQITSVVQNRGSIPLFWSQETSRLNMKPDIILSTRDQNYEATRLHFQNLVERYGNPIIILNLIKTNEKRPRESILRTEFANAIKSINKDLSEENHLKFLHWDLHKHSRSKGTNALLFLSRLTTYILTLTGFFYCQVSLAYRSEGCLRFPHFENNDASGYFDTSDVQENCLDGKSVEEKNKNSVRVPMLQKGILRTNCIDCLDRTNVAQYAYGLAALGHQLHALGAIDSSNIDLDDPLAEELMGLYEKMGDTLAHQYGGSAAHNKVFSERRGQWKAATQSQEFFRTLQRYYNNAYMDAEKQNAINLFLGDFQPQDGQPEVWELDSDHNISVNRNEQSMLGEDRRSHKKSLSDGNIIRETKSSTSNSSMGNSFACSSMLGRSPGGSKMISESTPDISACESSSTYSRYTPASIPQREPFEDLQKVGLCDNDKSDSFDFSNFIDLDWLSSSIHSTEEELPGRSNFKHSSMAGMSSENVSKEIVAESTPSTSESSIKGSKHNATESSCDDAKDFEVLEEYSDSFLRWINNGEMFCH